MIIGNFPEYESFIAVFNLFSSRISRKNLKVAVKTLKRKTVCACAIKLEKKTKTTNTYFL